MLPPKGEDWFRSPLPPPPLPKVLALDRAPRLGIIGFKVTAPIHHLSSIAETPKDLNALNEPLLLDQLLRHVEDRASGILAASLIEEGTIEPVVVPDRLFDARRGTRPTRTQMSLLREELGVDAILYGEIPWYGRTRLIYPILGEGLDIAGGSVVLGLATAWNPVPLFANLGFELLTSTPLWFGGAYLFGWAVRPVTVNVWVLSTTDGHEVWHKSAHRVLSPTILNSYPESERSKKEIQLEASLRGALQKIAKSLSKEEETQDRWRWDRR